MRTFSNLDDVWPAGLLRRLLAMVYDALVLLAVWMLVGFVAVALNGGEANTSPLFHSVLLVVTFVFFAYFWMRAGTTLGMQAWRLRVQSLEGGPLTLVQCLVRFIAAIVSLAACGLGYWWILFDDEKRSWPDIASRSRVVVLPKPKRRRH